MHIRDIDPFIESVKDEALGALDVPAEAGADISTGAPPDPHMGDRGFPCFALARHLRQAPAAIAQTIAEDIRQRTSDSALIEEVRADGPYVNVVFDRAELAEVVVSEALDDVHFGGHTAETAGHWMIEYSGPNTNKPQHLGHVRNDLLGQSIADIVDWAGHQTTRVNLINNRGIHICKSMLAYRKWGSGETPEDAGVKGDHLVGDYYVLFNDKLTEEYRRWQQTEAADEQLNAWLAERPDAPDTDHGGSTADAAELRRHLFADHRNEYFNQHSELGSQTKEMLRKWEAGEAETVELWKTMNRWVLDGFEETYQRLGVGFDEVYYESQTYQLGKDTILEALDAGRFDRLDDGAVVCDLESVGLQGRKVLLRNDGTSVYMTQDIGTALERFQTFEERDRPIDHMVYVVGNEQDYHFQVLFHILDMLRPGLADRLNHLSYGMVLLPSGHMKSRQGTVVDADDLMDEMQQLAEQAVVERWPDLDAAEVGQRARVIGMAALKFYILDFNPRTTVNFDPEESIQFQGRTGPYCLYSYARIQSIARRVGGWPDLTDARRRRCLQALGTDLEMALVRQLQQWPEVAAGAARDLDPSRVTEHIFELCKSFSTLYNDADHKIVDIDHDQRRNGLLYLSQAVAATLQKGLDLLGIATLDQM